MDKKPPVVLAQIPQALKMLFGLSDLEIQKLKGQIELPNSTFGGGASVDSIEGNLSKIFTGYSDISPERIPKYRDYDRMDQVSTEVQTALDIYAEEASQKDSKSGLKVWIDAKNDKLAEELNGMLQRIREDSKVYGQYRNLAKYGDCFLYLLLGGYGVHDVLFIHPQRVERVQHNGLLGFRSTELAGYIPMDSKNSGLFKPWEFIHIRLGAFEQESLYGRSMLESIRKIWNQFAMLETMIVLFRISKAVQRNIFYVDVGQASMQEAAQITKEYEKFLKSKVHFIDNNTKQFKLDFNPQTILQDIVWPIRTGSPTKVEALQSNANIGPIEDLEYFRKKIRSGLGIPQDYFDGEYSTGWNSRDALMLQDMRFGRKISKLQDGMREGIVKLCQIHWAITHQEFLHPTEFEVKLGTISESAERAREDVLLRKAQVLEILANISLTLGWNRWVWSDYLLDQVYPLPADFRQKLYTPDPKEEMEMDQEIKLKKAGSAGGAGGGGFGNNSSPANKAKKAKPKATANNLKMGFRKFGYGEDFPDPLEIPNDLMEEFTEAMDNLNETDDYLKEASKFGTLSENSILGFTAPEIEELIAHAKLNIPVNKSLQAIHESKKNLPIKQISELAMSPDLLKKGKSYDDDPLDSL